MAPWNDPSDVLKFNLTCNSKLFVVNSNTDFFPQIYEGERAKRVDNNLLDKFTLRDLPSRPKGEVKFDVIFDIDVNGILKVTAIETDTRKSLTVTVSKGISFHTLDKPVFLY